MSWTFGSLLEPRSNGDAGRAARVAVILALLIVPSRGAEAQSFRQDLREIFAERPESPRHKAKRESAPAPVDLERVAEVETVLAAAIRLYQSTLSTTDMNPCNFWPSCSHFGSASLHRYGVFKGMVLTADRLLRDNGLPSMRRNYPLDPATGKFLDPVERYGSR